MQGVRIDCACINSQSSFIFLNFRNSWRFAGLAAKDFDQEESLFYCPSSTWVSYTIFSPSMVSEWHDLHLNKTRVQWSSWLHYYIHRQNADRLSRSMWEKLAQCLKIREKVSFNIASEASYVWIFIGQNFFKNAKNGQFWQVLKNLKLAVKQCYQTGQLLSNKIDLSGNTVWPQASGFQKLAKIDHFWHFWWTFVHS